MQEYSYSKKLMGTEVSVSVVTPTEIMAKQLADEVLAVVHDYEQKFSRFVLNSELSNLNTAGRAIVSAEFFAVLKRSYELYEETQGAFNPLVQINRHGYDVDYAELNKTQRNQNTDTYNIDFSTVIMDEKTNQITLQANQQLDFNGILKGYLATKLAHELQAKYSYCRGLIINLGGDLYTLGQDENGKAFEFYLYNPITKTETSVYLTDTSLVTSGIYQRKWQTKQGDRHHILDASGTDNPHSDIVSASVIHKDGATAEAYATLFVVKGHKEAREIIKTNNPIYWLVQADGGVITNMT